MDPLQITYDIPRTAFTVGDTPVVIGSIYNKGPSKAKVKVGIEVEQVRHVSAGAIIVTIVLAQHNFEFRSVSTCLT